MNDDVLDDTMLENRPISRKRMKLMHVEVYNKLVDTLTELTNNCYWHWDEYDTCWCNHCMSHWKIKETHTDDCLIIRGRKLLRSLK